MWTIKRALVLSALLAVAPSTAVVAQDGGSRTIEQYSCKDVMRQSDSSRATAIAFLHGYLLGKSGSDKFNLDTMAKQTDAFINDCLDSPKDKAVDVMTKVSQ